MMKCLQEMKGRARCKEMCPSCNAFFGYGQLRLFTYPRRLTVARIWQSVLWTGALVQWGNDGR